MPRYFFNLWRHCPLEYSNSLPFPLLIPWGKRLFPMLSCSFASDQTTSTLETHCGSPLTLAAGSSVKLGARPAEPHHCWALEQQPPLFATVHLDSFRRTLDMRDHSSDHLRQVFCGKWGLGEMHSCKTGDEKMQKMSQRRERAPGAPFLVTMPVLFHFSVTREAKGT